MMFQEFLAPPETPPPLNIPPSSSIVKVSIIDSSFRLKLPMDILLEPHIKGKDQFSGPSYSFLIQHASGANLLFDLGGRKDWKNYAPIIRDMVVNGGWALEIPKDVPEILQENGVSPASITSIIWSHHHWDHIGDPSRFPSSTEIVVGPGFKAAFLPGFPADPTSSILESDYRDRPLREIHFDESETGLRIGRFAAHDFFGDGSFFLLSTPGHTIAHLCALARVSKAIGDADTDDDTFLFLGADVCHHAAEFRPSPYRPIPTTLSPSPLPPQRGPLCPGALFQALQPHGSAAKPFYNATSLIVHDAAAAQKSVSGTGEFDAADNVLVIIAHDEDALEILDFFPKDIGNWKQKGFGEKARWAFLKDFAEAVQ